MPHYWRIPEPDYNLDWAFKKSTWKKKKRNERKELRKKKRYRPKKKKVRGALKKELLQKERKEFPFGRPMYSLRNGESYRQVIYPKDVERIMGLTPRGARYKLAKIRKDVGKQKGDVVTITEFCEKTKIERNAVIKNLVD
jgi:hypothetical protein